MTYLLSCHHNRKINNHSAMFSVVGYTEIMHS